MGFSLKSLLVTAIAASCAATSAAQRRPDILIATRLLPDTLFATFSDPIAFVESDTGDALVLDRRKHGVFAVNAARTTVKQVLDIGIRGGQLLQPGALGMGPAGQFAVADAPENAQHILVDRIQYFSLAGTRLGGFYLPDQLWGKTRIGPLVMNGVGSLQWTDRGFLVSLPARKYLFTEFDLEGRTLRNFGELRATGQEHDDALHTLLNAGFPLPDPTGGFFFVFQTGQPMFRKYDAAGNLLFERHIQGLEIDARIRALPTVWPKPSGPGDRAYAEPLVRTAGVDREGNLWISLIEPYTYVYDGGGDKIRTVRFSAGGIMMPNSFFFTKDDRVLVTPECLEFKVR